MHTINHYEHIRDTAPEHRRLRPPTDYGPPSHHRPTDRTSHTDVEPRTRVQQEDPVTNW